MIKIEYEFISKSFVALLGSIKACIWCERLTEVMYLVSNHWWCAECFNYRQPTASDIKNSDAKFKCPQKNCSKIVSFREFLGGDCCSVARTNSKSRKYRANKCKNQAEFQNLTEMMSELELLQVEEKEAKNQMDSLEKDFKKATAKFEGKKKEREEFQEELATAFSESSENLSDKKETEHDSRCKCNICFEKYNATDRLQCVLQCGHPACAKCLGAMADKICHICRKPFTEDNIIKLFYN